MLMKQNVKQNKVHDEQIIVAKLWQKRNDFFVNCYGNKLGDVYRIYMYMLMTEYQITMKRMQI